ncbi:MAG: hypothetical protein KAR07_10970 [Spirochaetes bacterium]|nr:hypothetical protein [Spirochaetota bacterium]
MLDNLKKIFTQHKIEKNKTRNFEFGEDWEEEVRDDFFIPQWYELLEKTHDYEQNKKDYVKSSLNPDLKLLCNKTKRAFYVECKARDITKLLEKTKQSFDECDRLQAQDKSKLLAFEKANKYLQVIEICSKDQFLRFKKINNTEKVLFMVLLTSDHTYRDDVFSLIPIDDLLTHKVFYSHFLLNQIAQSEVEPTRLWRNFLLFHGLPGFCIRCNKKIKFNNFNPFCYECWSKWYDNNKFLHEENYCHACGKEYKTVSVKPLCIDCFKKFPINIGL